MVGNYPQAFSHLALVRAADAIHYAGGLQPASPLSVALGITALEQP
jgi:hypothetical protein